MYYFLEFSLRNVVSAVPAVSVIFNFKFQLCASYGLYEVIYYFMMGVKVVTLNKYKYNFIQKLTNISNSKLRQY